VPGNDYVVFKLCLIFCPGGFMPLNLEDKQAIVASVNAVASEALSAVIADYRGLGVSEMTDLRKQARDSGVYLRVVRNTLARRAVEGTEYECLQDSLVGPTVLAFSQEDPGAAARLIKEFAKEHEALEVKALSVGGKLYEASDIDVLAKLPTRDEALSMLMSVMQAPIAKFVRTLNEVPGKLVRTVAAVKDQKEAA
jgi:large subunit ribosomal protein L10